MKKQFLDFLYEQRVKVQLEIDKIVENKKNPIAVCCENMSNKIDNKEEDAKRAHIKTINDTISKYISIYETPSN